MCFAVGSAALRALRKGPRRACARAPRFLCHPRLQFKSSSNTPVMQGTRRAHKTERAVCPHTPALAACSSGRRAGWAVRWFDPLILSDVPGVVLCLYAQEEGAFHHIARYEALLAPRIRAQPFLANRSFTSWGSGDHGHREHKARGWLWFGKFVRRSVFVVSSERAKRDCVSPWPCQRRSHRARHAISTSILVVHALLLARRHREEQLLGAAIVSVVGSFLPSSTAVACWVTDGGNGVAIRHGRVE